MNRRSEPKTAPPTLRERIRETTVQTILDAAEEVFADAGLHAAHMGTIAAKAGVSVGTLYNHFEDREALLAGLLAARRADLVGKIDAAVADAAARPLRERLRGILGAFISHCDAHRKFVHVVLQREMGRHQQTFPLAWAKKHDTMREIYERVEDQMKRGVKERVLRPEVADLGATFFFGMMRALVIRELVFEAGGDMMADADRLLDVFFEGVSVRRAAA
jgi:AcrR family transcriptional regulator